MKRAFLIHGWEGRPDGNWFPWLSLELKARGWEVNAPQMPSSKTPDTKAWVDFLRKYVGRCDLNTYFVGHSFGCATIARYLAELPPKSKAGGVLFVAGFSGKLIIPDFANFDLPIEAGLSRKQCGKFVCIFSDNDTDVPLEKSLVFAKELGAKTILERGKGHFCTSDGVTALPSVLSSLLKMTELNAKR